MARTIPFRFVLDLLDEAGPFTKPMFGCEAVYIEEKIVLVLRDRPKSKEDNGVWLATTKEHHASLKKIFPRMRSIKVFETPVTGWQVLPVDSPDFEESVEHACHLILAGDPRIGKVPAKRRTRSKNKSAHATQVPRRKSLKKPVRK